MDRCGNSTAPAYDAKEPISGTKTNIHYNIYGGNLGGPLFIPHVYNTDKQKTFFFWNEEWRKILSGAGTTNVPTLPNADRPTLGTDLTYTSPAFTIDSKNPTGNAENMVVPDLGDPTYKTSHADVARPDRWRVLQPPGKGTEHAQSEQ